MEPWLPGGIGSPWGRPAGNGAPVPLLALRICIPVPPNGTAPWGQEGEVRDLCSTAVRSSSASIELSCIHLRCNPILLPDGPGVKGRNAGRYLQSRERAAGAVQFVTHLPSSSRPQNHEGSLPVQIPALQSQPESGEHRCADGRAHRAPSDSIPPIQACSRPHSSLLFSRTARPAFPKWLKKSKRGGGG